MHEKSEPMVFEGTINCEHYGWLIVTPFLREKRRENIQLVNAGDCHSIHNNFSYCTRRYIHQTASNSKTVASQISRFEETQLHCNYKT